MPASEDNRPNLILITTDQMRGDCLSCDGHPVVRTPNLDTMALEGVRFSRAYTACPSCIPARAAMLTGLSQSSHGRVGYRDGVPWRYETTLPGELAKAGYHTQGVGKMHFFPARSLCGFHNVVLHDGYLHHERKVNKRLETVDDYLPWFRERAGAEADIIGHGLEANSWVTRPWNYDENLHPTNWVVTKSVEFLNRRDPAKPFFLWMSFVRPHSPLDPPQAYWDMYRDVEIPDAPVGDWAKEFPQNSPIHASAYEGRLDPRDFRRARAAYYALVTHIDHQLGRFHEALHEFGLLSNTIVIFTSDHGDLLGDHNLLRKALPYEGSTRVPCVLWASPQCDLGLSRGRVVDRVVELRDIMPTLLDAAGVTAPKSVEGMSILPLARGESPKWREYLHGEHTYREQSIHYVTDGREKYVWFSGEGREQLFDLAKDPQELHDLSADSARKVRLEHWRSILIKELAGREEGASDGKRLITGRPFEPCLSHVL